MTDGFLLSATYATRTGRLGARSLSLDRPTADEAVDEFTRRLERQGCSKIDIRNYGRPKS